MFDLSTKELLSLGAIGALITTLGSLLALVLKEFVAARIMERWRASVAAKSIFQRYRDPLSLAASELANRLIEVVEKERPNFLRPDVLSIDRARIEKNDDEDLYFQKYKYDSTIFRLASFLGWTELFRQDVTFLDSGHTGTNEDIHNCLGELRSLLADGHLSSDLPDWREWRDYLIFREEQRAIGESMINDQAEPRRIFGYAEFISSYKERNARWQACAAGFFENLGEEDKDFRVERCRRLVIGLGRLLVLTNKRLLTSRITEAVNRYSTQNVDSYARMAKSSSIVDRCAGFANQLSS
jgi:hypothetical protein